MPIQNPMNLTLPPSLYGGGLVLPYLDNAPMFGVDVFIAPNASIIGRVTLDDRVSIWFGSVLRADIAEVRVGEGSNIQDGSVLHVGDEDPCLVGAHVTVGHHVILHGCAIEDECMIGMGAIILNKARIGRGTVVGAGAVVTQNTIVPPYSLVLGSPAKVKRPLTEEERRAHGHFAGKYAQVAANYRPLFK